METPFPKSIQAKGFSKLESVNPDEFNVYFVEEIERNNIKGYRIVLKTSQTDTESIFGLDADESGAE